MPTTAYERTMRAARADVLRVRDAAEREIAAHFDTARARLTTPYKQFAARYASERARLLADAQASAADGESVTQPHVPQSWLLSPHGGNLAALQAETTDAMRTFARQSFSAVQRAHRGAVVAGDSKAQHMVLAALKPIVELMPPDFWRPANRAGLSALEHEAAPGGPLDALFATFGPNAARELRTTLAAGMAGGVHPSVLARDMFDVIKSSNGGSYSRAVTIARTTVIRAWHDAALENYRANKDVVDGWIWMADKGSACAACLAMDGTQHTLDEDIDDHPRGKCARGPITKSYADILESYGIDTSDMDLPDPPWQSYQSGADWLDGQDAATQRAAFGGQAAYNAYKSGDADLSDFAAVSSSVTWGDSIQQASLRSMGLDAADYSDGG